MHLSKVKYVRFGRLFIYVFVLFEKEDSRNINPWWWWQWLLLRIGHSEGTWEDMSCCSREYESLRLTVVSVSDMARVRGKMCVTCRRPTTRTATVLVTPPSQRLDGPLILSPTCWRAGHRRFIMSRWTGVLFHIHRRSVLLQCRALFPSDLCYLETIASMFCKSCNCNSSIATRIGFAVRSQLQCPVPTFLICVGR